MAKVNLWTADLASNADVRKAERMKDRQRFFLACGCSTRGLGIDFCPLHAAAEEMRALLEDYEREHFNDRGRECPCWQCERVRALLAKVTA